MNRGELKSLVSTLGKRTDVTDDLLNSFVTNAEEMVAKHVRAVEMVGIATIDETDRDEGPRYNLPADYLGWRSLYRAGEQEYPLECVSLPELRIVSRSSGAYFFATYGLYLEIRGTPPTDTEFELIYYARPAAMTDDADEPALLTGYPTIYLHAALHWYRIWSEDAELAAAHKSAFIAEAEEVNALAAEQRRGAKRGPTTPVRTRSSM